MKTNGVAVSTVSNFSWKKRKSLILLGTLGTFWHKVFFLVKSRINQKITTHALATLSSNFQIWLFAATFGYLIILVREIEFLSKSRQTNVLPKGWKIITYFRVERDNEFLSRYHCCGAIVKPKINKILKSTG